MAFIKIVELEEVTNTLKAEYNAAIECAGKVFNASKPEMLQL